MVATGRHARPTERSEEAGALVSAVLGVTASGASVIVVMQAVGGSLPFIALPTAVLLAAIIGRREQVALWAAVAAWVVIIPLASGNGVLAPLLMVAVCATLALGPERVLDWVARDWSGRPTDAESTATGWIEDDPRVR